MITKFAINTVYVLKLPHSNCNSLSHQKRITGHCATWKWINCKAISLLNYERFEIKMYLICDSVSDSEGLIGTTIRYNQFWCTRDMVPSHRLNKIIRIKVITVTLSGREHRVFQRFVKEKPVSEWSAHIKTLHLLQVYLNCSFVFIYF